MRLLASLVSAYAFRLAFAYTDPSNNQPSLATDTTPKSHLIALRQDCHLRHNFSTPHAKLYHQLESWNVSWTTIKEYADEMLTGAVVKLGSVAERDKIAVEHCIESITPMRHYAGPTIIASANSTVTRRAVKLADDAYWPHRVTDVSFLRGRGYRGKNIKIGIIDSGVDYYHHDLGGGFGPGYKVIGGYDFVGDDYTGEPGSIRRQSKDPMDQCRGHGTMVAGIIGANDYSSHDIMGFAPEASLNAYRIFGCRGGTSDAVLIDALLRAKKDGNHIVTISMPWTDWKAGSAAVVAGRLAKSGTIVSVPAGDDGEDGFWRGWSNTERLGVVSVGSVYKSRPRLFDTLDEPNYKEIEMSPTSSLGPTNDLYMTPTLSFPGVDILSTFPDQLGSYHKDSGTEFAAAFFSGAAALWLQSSAKPSKNAKAAVVAFQNTAVPLVRDLGTYNQSRSVAHQAAGLADVSDAVFTRSFMQPTQLLLNDTANFRGTWKLQITNLYKVPLTYALTHVPADTIPTVKGMEIMDRVEPLEFGHAYVRIEPESVVVPAGASRYVTVYFKPPTSVDPTTFPVYSGYIQATSSKKPAIRSAYLGLAASMKDMKILDDTDSHLGFDLPYVGNKNNKPISGRTTYTMVGADKPTLVYRLVGCTRLLRIDLVDPSFGFSSRGYTGRDLGPDSGPDSGPGFKDPWRPGEGSLWLSILRHMWRRRWRIRWRPEWLGWLPESWPEWWPESWPEWWPQSWPEWQLEWESRSMTPEISAFGKHMRKCWSKQTKWCRENTFGGAKIVGTILKRVSVQRHSLKSGLGREAHSTVTIDKFSNGSPIPNGLYMLLVRALKITGNPDKLEDWEVWMSEEIVLNRAVPLG